ncbi:MAG: hypothetical protein KDN22_06590 [Verrucomicrobiae bacterium]|nr:hypothetical protein [Verrucomicrobiae bacterium]
MRKENHRFEALMQTAITRERNRGTAGRKRGRQIKFGVALCAAVFLGSSILLDGSPLLLLLAAFNYFVVFSVFAEFVNVPKTYSQDASPLFESTRPFEIMEKFLREERGVQLVWVVAIPVISVLGRLLYILTFT